MASIVLLAALAFGPADLADLYRELDIAWRSDAPTGREEVTAGGTAIVFAPGIPVVLVDDMPRRYAEAPRLEGGRLLLPAELAQIIRESAPPRRPPEPEEPVVKAEKFPPFSIVIDPGHGGMHTGCKGRTLVEKDVVLDVSLRLKGILEAGGVRVTMTRTTDRHFAKDVHEDLQCRCDIANRVKPDLFLSIHANWVENAEPRGFEVWVPQKAEGNRGRESRAIAESVRREFRRAMEGPDRGIKDERNLYVLRNTACPAVLIEIEFLSNPQAERELSDPDHRREVAGTIAEALRRHFARRKKP